MPTTLPNTSKFGGRRVYNGLWPTDLSKGLKVTIDLTAVASLPWMVDLSEEQELGQIPFVQSAWIDNSGNTVGLILTTSIGQSITVAAGWQGFYPILDTDHRFTVTTVAGAAGQNAQTTIIFLSVPMPASSWNS